MRKYKYWHLCLALLLSIGCLSCAQNKATIELKDDEKLIEFTTDRFTLPNLHVTPDGNNIIFDVLGDIYQVPIEGGKAEVLLKDNNWKRAGKLSPDGKTLAYVSDETGVFQVWTMDLETRNKRVYPIIEFVHYPLYAYWKDKRHLLIPSKEGLQIFDIVTGEGQIIRPALDGERSVMDAINRKISVLKSGDYAFFQKEKDLLRFDVSNKRDEFIKEIPYSSHVEELRVNSEGNSILFYKINKGYTSTQDLIYWNLKSGKTRILYSTDILGSSTTLNHSFDFINDTAIVLDKEGEIVRMDIKTGDYEPIPIKVDVKKVIKKPLRREPQYVKDSIITASVLRNPVTKSDLDTIYFGAFGKLHSYSKNTKQITEVYPNEDRFEVSFSFSPDGKYLTYTTWNDNEMGHIYIREIKTGKESQLTSTPGRYISPAWSPDGSELVFIADETEVKMGIPRQTPGSNTLLYYLDIHRVNVSDLKKVEGEESEVIKRITSSTVLSKRFYPILIYHPSGKSVFISTRNQEKDLPVLIKIDLDTKKIENERLIPFHTDEVLVSPDAKHIAFIFDDQVWVDTMPYSTKIVFSDVSKFINRKYHYKGGVVNNILLPNAKPIFEIAPSYLSWQDEHTLMWGSVEEVYTYDVRTGKTEKIADIQVQKPRAVPKTKYALTNARIITMNKQEEVIEKGTILVKDNRIEAVGRISEISIPENYKIFNLEEKTIMPGVIDVHAHYHHAPYELQWQQNYKYVGNLAYGVTSIYDPSVNVLDYREQAQMVETGVLLGPRVFASGNIIDDYPKVYDYKTIHSLIDVDRIVQSNKKMGVYSPLKQYNRSNRLHRKWLYKSAKKDSLTITNHEKSFLTVLTQIIDGYTAMEHEKYTFSIQKDILELIGQSGIHYTPTYIVSPGIADIYSEFTLKEKNKLLKFNGKVLYHNSYDYSNNYQDSKRQAVIDNWNDIRKLEHSRASHTLKRIINSRGKISIGGHGNPLPGIGTHWELWFMTKGMSNYQALQAATINGAEKLDLQEEIGSIEKWKLADMVVLNTSPLESIYNTTDILYTIQNGNIYEAETMKQIYPVEKELQPWGWDSPIVLKSMQRIYKSE